MKYILNIIIILFLFQGCHMPWDEESTIYKNFHFQSFFVDTDNSMILRYQYNSSDDEKYIQFNSTSKKWEERISKTNNQISQEVISFINGKTIIENKEGTIVFELIPPTIQEIENTTGISLPNSMAYYNLFKSAKEYKWDRTTYIVNIGIEKEKRDKNSDSYTFTEVHCFSLSFNDVNDIWTIVYVGKRPDLTYDEGSYYYEDDLNISVDETDTETWSHRKFIDSHTISLCHNWTESKCFVKSDNNSIELKKLYGEILPTEYKITLDKLYKTKAFRSPSPSLYFFDNNLTMHIFYNDVENAKGKYFKYRMYKKENPTVPLHEQKIYWK